MTRYNWRELITLEMEAHGEDWGHVVSHTLTEGQLDKRFDAGYGGYEGVPFTLWTHKRVYFPEGYDGAEGCVSVSREPDGIPTKHVGGGG